MNYILQLDTSGSICQVAISLNGNILAEAFLYESREQSSQINSLIDEVLSKVTISIKDIKAISVCNGPGSYTGLRVGLATAKGIAYALSIPIILHNKLYLIGKERINGIGFEVVTLKAREGEVFVAEFQNGVLHNPPYHEFLPEMLNKLKNNAEVKGIYVEDILEAEFSDFTLQTFPSDQGFTMELWAKESNICFVKNEFSDLAYSEPFYMKAAFTTHQKK